MVTNTQLAPEVNLTIDPAIRKPTPYQLQQIVYQNLVQHKQAFTGVCWQSSVAITDRMGKTLNLITNISLAMNEGDHLKEAKWGCNLEIEAFHKSPTKEAYNVEMEQKILEFFKLREGSEDRGNEDRRREDQHHIYTEYKKAREDTFKFVQDNLALALNFKPDGSTEKELDTGATADLAMPSSRASGSPSVP
ncbi:hypothetical protein BKA59DRAFT_523967 [Fusarium tricinctum]|uniref:Uncharacterized protein n=1 Tax=Fusarium tricinctum TaxID=61284 RepID=A0A8K0S3K0_9HYPO|nr:hypothetical protein BKA59DRAFT_523967 [Fusarium tricinctum]